jgi:hypothetical protein
LLLRRFKTPALIKIITKNNTDAEGENIGRNVMQPKQVNRE